MREGYEVYWMYVEDLLEEIKQDQEVVLEVRDLSEFTRKVVRAQVKENAEDLPGAEQLWIRNLKDEITDQCWAIKIVEELPDDAFNPRTYPKNSPAPEYLWSVTNPEAKCNRKPLWSSFPKADLHNSNEGEKA